MIEAAAILAMLIGGCFLVLKLGIGGWTVPGLGYIVGVCLSIVIGLIQIILTFPTDPILTLSVTSLAPLFWWLSGRHPRRFPYSAIQVAATVVVVICVVYFFRHANIVGWTRDTFRYLMIGALIASDNFDSVKPWLLQQRLIAIPILHAPANLAGEFYLRSAGPLLAISGISLFVWVSLNGLAPRRTYGPVVLTALGILLLVTNARMVWSAFALLPHLLCAVLILLIVGCGWLIATTNNRSESNGIHPRGLIALQSLAIPALVVLRPEGGLLAAISILPTLLWGEVALKYRAFLLCAFGASLALWNLVLLRANFEFPFARHAGTATILGPLAVAILSLVAASLLFVRKIRPHTTVLERRRALILFLANMALWIFLATAAMLEPETLRKSIIATKENLLYGAGGWGYSLVILGILVFICAVAARGGELIFLGFPVISFIPLLFLLAYARDNEYRIGAGDSLNRMWIHIVPLAALFVVAAVNSDQWRGLFPSMLSRWQRKGYLPTRCVKGIANLEKS